MRVLCTGGSGFIGTHLVDSLIEKGIELINVDIKPPKKLEQNPYWKECNILDFDNILKLFSNFRPTHVVHLAARTSMDGKTLADFYENTTGTEMVLKAIKGVDSIARVVVTSSQHVRKPGSGIPKNDEDYNPHGLYGKSKVITETITRNANLPCDWVIIRPTTIWGPWHPYLPSGLWSMMKKGFYFHPKNDPVIRSYGYVKNITWQIEKILEAPTAMVNHKVFYVADSLVPQIEWVNMFSLALTNHKVTQIPRGWIKFLSMIGDGLSTIGIKFPMNEPRFFNLTTNNPVPIEPILTLFGKPPYTMDMGVIETISWLNNRGIS